jgi:hypothetical protein
LWFQWIMATTLGWLLGRFLLPNLSIVTIGLGLGVLQWLVLLHRLRRAWWWIIATALGWMCGMAVGYAVVPGMLDLFAGLLVGAAMGIAQWLILRRELHWAGWWIAISVVGWSTGMTLMPGVLITGVMAGALTGIALVLLMRFPRPVGLERTG